MARAAAIATPCGTTDQLVTIRESLDGIGIGIGIGIGAGAGAW